MNLAPSGAGYINIKIILAPKGASRFRTQNIRYDIFLFLNRPQLQHLTNSDLLRKLMLETTLEDQDSDVILALQGSSHRKTKILLPHLTTPTVIMLLMVSELY